MKKILIFVVVLIATSLISGISGVQARGISGRVTNESGNGIANVYVAAFDYNSNLWIIGSSTDSDGNYSLNVRAGTYKVRFRQSPSEGFYAHQWYDDRSNPVTADLVTVKGFRTITNIDAQLEIGGTIFGRVTDASKVAIADVYVSAMDSNSSRWIYGLNTDSNGNYSFNLPAGTYKVYFSPLPSSGYNAPEWFNNKPNSQAADLVTVTPQTTSNINAQLEIGGTISGRVTNPLGYGIANVYVGAAAQPVYNWMGGVSTDSNGNYSFNVPAGTYRVQFYPQSSVRRYYAYAPEWYENKSNFHAGDLISVTAGATSNINAQLEIGGKISGRVTDSSGNGIADVYVQAFDPDSANIVFNGGLTNSEGFYNISLAAGNYKVRFSPGPDSGNYALEWYNNKTDFHPADIVTVKRFRESTINVELQPK